MRAPLVDTYNLGLAYAHIGSGRVGNRLSPEGVDNTLSAPMQVRELIKGFVDTLRKITDALD